MKSASAETLYADIRGKCLECCGGSRKLVDECMIKDCRLWKHRRGLAGVQTGMLPVESLKGQIDMWGGAANDHQRGRNSSDDPGADPVLDLHRPLLNPAAS